MAITIPIARTTKAPPMLSKVSSAAASSADVLSSYEIEKVYNNYYF